MRLQCRRKVCLTGVALVCVLSFAASLLYINKFWGGEEFADQFFAPVLDSFRVVANGSYKKPPTLRFRSGNVPMAFFYVKEQFVKNRWLTAHMMDITQGLCPLPCKYTTDRNQIRSSDVVMIHLRSVSSREKLLHDLSPRDLSQPWILFEPETHIMSNRYLNYSSLYGIFNRTMHHRRDSDILMLHGFIVQRGPDANLLPPSWVIPPLQKTPHNRTDLAVAFISNCKRNSGRLHYIKELQRYMKVDVYGKCGDKKCGRSRYVEHQYKPDTDKCMQMAGNKYLFYLAFENNFCRDYVTEKLYNLLYYPMVPVVRGAADYAALMPPNSYIDASKFTPQQLAHKLTHLAAHPEEYEELLVWRQQYQPSTVGGARVLCDLCWQLHQPRLYQPHVYHSFHDWYVAGAQCQDLDNHRG